MNLNVLIIKWAMKTEWFHRFLNLFIFVKRKDMLQSTGILPSLILSFNIFESMPTRDKAAHLGMLGEISAVSGGLDESSLRTACNNTSLFLR